MRRAPNLRVAFTLNQHKMFLLTERERAETVARLIDNAGNSVYSRAWTWLTDRLAGDDVLREAALGAFRRDIQYIGGLEQAVANAFVAPCDIPDLPAGLSRACRGDFDLCVACPDEMVCGADGRCACPPSGTRQCIDGEVWRIDGCGDPVSVETTCEPGEQCLDARCVDMCAMTGCPVCRRCTAEGCIPDAAADGSSCGSRSECLRGSCVEICVRRDCGPCERFDADQCICTADPSAEGSACGDGMRCDDRGRCGSCHECPTDATKCGPQGREQCSRVFDCRRWVRAPCDLGEECRNGECVCEPDVACGAWGACVDHLRRRDCVDANRCVPTRIQSEPCGSVTIDNDSEGFAHSSGPYWWSARSRAGFDSGGIDGDIRYTFGEGSSGGSYTGTWRTGTPLRGRFRIEAHIPDPDAFDPNPVGEPQNWVDCRDTTYSVRHDSAPGGESIRLDAIQTGWRPLGTFTFTGREGIVTLSDRASPVWCAVVYDAVRWVAIP